MTVYPLTFISTKEITINQNVETVLGVLAQFTATLLHKAYPFDHQWIDVDFENMVLLTNEHIKATHPLTDEDEQFYKAFKEQKLRLQEQKEHKRQEQINRYLLNKKRRKMEAFQKY